MHVKLEGVERPVFLPLGIHAIYEALAWSANAAFPDSLEIGTTLRNAGSLLYTWPLWVLASLKECAIEDIDVVDVVGVLPLLSIACFYDYRILPDPDPGLPQDLLAIHSTLQERGVTAGRLIWQLFRDYGSFWSVRLNSSNTNRYLQKIGLPTLQDMLKGVRALIEHLLALSKRTVNEGLASADSVNILFYDDILAEIDLLQTSAWNVDILNEKVDEMLRSPLSLAEDLVPLVCAAENTHGYDWMAVNNSDRVGIKRPWSAQGESRIILRQQLSISEHVLMQLAFGDHVACYGAIDWRIPINRCPVARECMERTQKRGIEFCVDPAWRHYVAAATTGLYNHRNEQPTDDEIPGIAQAIAEYYEALKGNGPDIADPAVIDYARLGLDSLRFQKKIGDS